VLVVVLLVVVVDEVVAVIGGGVGANVSPGGNGVGAGVGTSVGDRVGNWVGDAVGAWVAWDTVTVAPIGNVCTKVVLTVTTPAVAKRRPSLATTAITVFVSDIPLLESVKNLPTSIPVISATASVALPARTSPVVLVTTIAGASFMQIGAELTCAPGDVGELKKTSCSGL
jgi:hypothetical protein